jgi:fatty-acyl-CoA synthase
MRRATCTPATSRRWTREGYVNIAGRIKDMVIRGGENVYPREIEEFLVRSPGDQGRLGDRRSRREIRRRAVRVGRPAARSEPTEETVREFCRGKIAHYKVPRYVKFVERVSDDGYR